MSDMRWFGKAVPLIAMGKQTVKQPVHVSVLECGERWRFSIPFDRKKSRDENSLCTVLVMTVRLDYPSYVAILVPLFLQVVDVARAILNAVKDPDANGKTYALVG